MYDVQVKYPTAILVGYDHDNRIFRELNKVLGAQARVQGLAAAADQCHNQEHAAHDNTRLFVKIRY
jgi:hypothetical protein